MSDSQQVQQNKQDEQPKRNRMVDSVGDRAQEVMYDDAQKIALLIITLRMLTSISARRILAKPRPSSLTPPGASLISTRSRYDHHAPLCAGHLANQNFSQRASFTLLRTARYGSLSSPSLALMCSSRSASSAACSPSHTFHSSPFSFLSMGLWLSLRLCYSSSMRAPPSSISSLETGCSRMLCSIPLMAHSLLARTPTLSGRAERSSLAVTPWPS